MDWKSFSLGVLVAVVILLILATFGIAHIGSLNGKVISSNSQINFNNIPEKCKVGAGYDIESWKEHLGHHAETRECLQYYS